MQTSEPKLAFKGWVSFLGFFIFLGMWQCCSRLSPHLLFVLPAPTDVVKTLFECRSRLLFHSWMTCKEMLGGFFLALTVAFPLAWTMMRYTTSRALLQPFFIFVQCLPMFTLAPIMVIWFGWSYIAIVIPTALMIFFPLTLNIYQGLRSTPQDLLEFFRTHQATGWQTFIKLRLPWALPHIFSGLRISAAIAGIGAIAGEWAGAQFGLGMLMLESRRCADLEMTFSALTCLTFMSAFFYTVILLMEKNLLPSREKFLSHQYSSKRLGLFRKNRWSAAAASFLLFLIGLAGCDTHPKGLPFLVLDWLPNPNHIPLYVGIEKGFFEKEGVSFSIRKMHENGGGIAYLTSHQADLLISHLPSTLRAASRGAKLKIVGTLIKEPLNALIYRKDGNISSIHHLNNSRLGYCIGGSDTAFLDFILQKAEVEPKEKRNVSVDLISAMGTKSVDMIYGGFWNIEPFQLRSLGIETGFCKLEEFNIPPYYEMIILANADTPFADSAFVSRFKRAIQKSIDYCKAYPEDAFSIYLRSHPDKRDKTLAWEKEAWKCTSLLLADDQVIDPDLLLQFYNWFYENQFLKKEFNFLNLIDFN